MISYFRANVRIERAKFYEIEQANYWAFVLCRENTIRKDTLKFAALKTGYLDVYLNPLYVIVVSNAPNVPSDVNQYISHIETSKQGN